jgi:hypothetical protein
VRLSKALELQQSHAQELFYMAQSKDKKITNMLKRHDDAMDSKLGKSLINDFLQLSNILESLKETDTKAFTAFYALIEHNLELETLLKERGNRISKLQKGQTQPKGTGKKSISTHVKRSSE